MTSVNFSTMYGNCKQGMPRERGWGGDKNNKKYFSYFPFHSSFSFFPHIVHTYLFLSLEILLLHFRWSLFPAVDGPEPRAHHTAIVLQTSLMIVFGGQLPSGEASDELWMLDLDPTPTETIVPGCERKGKKKADKK